MNFIDANFHSFAITVAHRNARDRCLRKFTRTDFISPQSGASAPIAGFNGFSIADTEMNRAGAARRPSIRRSY
ncbi:MAG: hypothetical protein AB1810_01510 [Pseudomonadota bacterium]